MPRRRHPNPFPTVTGGWVLIASSRTGAQPLCATMRADVTRCAGGQLTCPVLSHNPRWLLPSERRANHCIIVVMTMLEHRHRLSPYWSCACFEDTGRSRSGWTTLPPSRARTPGHHRRLLTESRCSALDLGTEFSQALAAAVFLDDMATTPAYRLQGGRRVRAFRTCALHQAAGNAVSGRSVVARARWLSDAL